MKNEIQPKGMRNTMDDLFQDEANAVKKCSYKGCENTMPASVESEYCEVCRCLVIRNNLTITLDPTSPFSDRRDMVFGRMIHLMKPDEIIQAIDKLQWAYLELNKIAKSDLIEKHKAARNQEAMRLVNEERSKPKTPKTAKKRGKRNSILSEMSDEERKSILDEDKIDF